MATTKVSSVSFPSQTQSSRKHSWETPADIRSARVFVSTRTRTGQRMPKWREVIEQGGNATTPLTARWDIFESDRPLKPVRLKLHSDLGPWDAEHKVWGDIGLTNDQRNLASYAPNNMAAVDADNIARAKFYKKLYELKTKFQGLTFAGELRETLHMLRRPAAALWDKNLGYLSALRKRKRRDPKHWLKTASGLWLEQAFGWKPLLMDCKSAYEAYKELVKPDERLVYKISASGIVTKDRSNELLPGYRTGDQLFILQAQMWNTSQSRLVEVGSVRYKGAVRAQRRATQWDNMELFGFNAENFIPTAWELLPWSFLIDYFTNIGDILQCAVTQTSDVTYVNRSQISETYFDNTVEHMTDVKPPGYTAAHWQIVSGEPSKWHCQIRRREVTRTPNSGISMPTLKLSFDLSDGQLGNMAALLGQANSLHRQSRRLRL